MTGARERLRVAFVAGTLAQGGAEKQLVCMVRALREAGALVDVHCLEGGGHYARELAQLGVAPRELGDHAPPPVRVLRLVSAVRRARPHVIQAAHFYVNLYAAIAARASGALSVGALRSDGWKDLRDTGRWGRSLLRMPDLLVTNSEAGRRNAIALGADPGRIHLVPNVLPGGDDERAARGTTAGPPGTMRILAVAGLHRDKRLDRLLRALAIARQTNAGVTALVAGDGPERPRLEALAQSLGLPPGAVVFLGHQPDVGALLGQADMLALTSEHEGFPNVLLEAMAAGLPVITTPAGDAGRIVLHGVTGYVVGFDDDRAMAGRICALAASADLRAQFGAAGRNRVRAEFSAERLPAELLAVYRAGALRRRSRRLLPALARCEALAGPGARTCPA